MSEPSSSGVPAPAEEPSGYRRTANGLVASLVVTVLVVLAFVAFRGIFRDQPVIEPEPVDYLGPVAAAQGAGVVLVYPQDLPDDWIPTSIDYEPGDPPGWSIGFLTDDGKYVGLRQNDDDAEDLVSMYVDGAAADEGTVELESSLATTWQAWSDSGGDLGYSSEPAALGGVTLLVYGSAPAADQEQLIALLTTEPIG